MDWTDDFENDSCEHYRNKFPANIIKLLGAMIKVELNDEGERGIFVGCFVHEVCIGELKGRFGDVPSQFGCEAFSGSELDIIFHHCECMLTYSVAKIKIKNRADQSGVTGDILHIENTFVDHQYRRMGIGRHLSQIMANEAERVGVKHIVLIPMDIGTGTREEENTAEAFWNSLDIIELRLCEYKLALSVNYLEVVYLVKSVSSGPYIP